MAQKHGPNMPVAAVDPADVFGYTNFEKTKDDFHRVSSDEPHAIRRKLILAAHPEIRDLFGPEPLTILIVFGILASQLWICSWITTSSWWVFLIVAYVYGGTVSHTLQLAAHEISHNLSTGSTTGDLIMGCLANLATGFPSSVTFRRYHMDHHQRQGVDGIDTDIPSLHEMKIFQGTLGKLLWLSIQPVWYAGRPILVAPKAKGKWEIYNYIVQFSFNAALVHFFGWKALLYLVLGTFLGLGLHPCAGHFIAEHYEFVNGVETYSYYGPLNFFNLNVGFHNEHHDFPKIPWSRLGQVKEIAPEFYNNLPYHTSYLRLFWEFITDSNMGLHSRVVRQKKKRS